MDDFFPYLLDRRFQAVWWPLGVRDTDGVTVTDDRFVATYGRWRVDTPLDNISEVRVTGPYRWWRAVGLRGSGKDSGATFGTTPRGGVCVLFHEKVAKMLPNGPHRGLTVTVADTQGLVDRLERR